jgi:glutamate-1-semialdehyde 2,1-aminomutase
MNSQEFFQSARQYIPGGVNSPVRSFKHVKRDPIFFERAEGAYLYDIDGKEYVDFCLSFGPHILGHSHPKVVKAIKAQAEKATSFGACHPGEVELARLLLKGYPWLHRARLVNSGTEAVMTAIRVARGFTGRNKIVKFEGCYHGHSDGLLAKAGSGVAELSESSSKGVPKSVVEDTLIARLDSFPTVKAHFEKFGSDIAAVIVEPIPANDGLLVPSRGDLENIIEIAKRNGALVIFDEVISGFRIGLSGACGYFKFEPDIVTLGKIIGGGLPLAALLGRAEIMESLAPLGPVYQAGTLSGNPLATAAGIAVLNEIYDRPPYEDLAKRTKNFVSQLRNILSPWGPVTIRQCASMFWISFNNDSPQFPPPMPTESHEKYIRLFSSLLSQGVYLAPSPYEVSFLSVAHTDEVLASVLSKVERCVKGS